MSGFEKVDIQVSENGKSLIVAYVLWFFLGIFGVHRFYLGRVKSGLWMLGLTAVGYLLTILIIGILPLIAVGFWWCIDAYFTYKITNEVNEKLGVHEPSISIGTRQNKTKDRVTQLKDLVVMKEQGHLTDEEFEKEKKGLLDND